MLTTLTIILVAIVVAPAYAHTTDFPHEEKGFSFVKPDFIFRITNIIEDIRLGLADASDKVELIKEFAKDKQTRIDEALARGQSVPMELEERRKSLLNTEIPVRNNEDFNNVKDAFSKIKTELNNLGEFNEIRILYSQFPDCVESCTVEQKQLFNDKVNALDTWKNKCSGTFNINDYEFDDNSFDRLTIKCPDLNKFSKNHIKSVINGN